MYTKLMIDYLEAVAIILLEREAITIKEFENRIKRLNKLRDDLEEKEQEFVNEMWEQEREVQQDMSRGGL